MQMIASELEDQTGAFCSYLAGVTSDVETSI